MPSVEFGLRFCEDGGMLLLGAGELPEPELPKQLPEDKVALDLWHWRDPLLQPMQQKRQGQLRSRGIPIVYSFAERRLRILGDDEIDPPSFATRDGSRLLVHDQDPYQVELSWDTSYHDVLLLNTFDGKRETLVKRLRGRATASPGGRFVCWFDAERDWHAYELATQQTHCLSRGIETGVVNELHDQPSPAGGYGIGGWTEADRSVLIYDRYDVFEVVPGGAVTCVTDGYGRAEQIVLRYVRTDPDPDERFVPADRPLLLSAVAETTRASGYYTDRLGAVERPRRLVMLDKSFGGLLVPKLEPKRRFFTLSTFRDFPDLWTAGEEFAGITRLTRANPQQDSIRWGDAELVRWSSLDGRELSGVLIKPEGFDPARRHPLLVHIYERLSQGLHGYRAPGPGTSPNASWYVSNGYLWFMPDITYEVGHPGESALKCVVPGVHHLLAQGFVDPERIGISGHSWGGYQTAYLVTRTSLFRAAEAGAPVANMTSAYGGIRWSTGMSRMFQYEQTQSRIGATLWHAPWLFIENSPLFELDRVVTPLLILHNDQDGAVPWYQGIELFTALRRLGKEAYLFNYVGEDHGLRRRANQLDWTVRMAEFFDHHLRGRPAPRWMRDGVPFDYREREKLDRIAPQPAEAAGGTGAAAAAEAAK
jgi:dipeptidyl aminopeptidase/acylaminoacyl peptidase